jgi:hypothetical protein
MRQSKRWFLARSRAESHSEWHGSECGQALVHFRRMLRIHECDIVDRWGKIKGKT